MIIIDLLIPFSESELVPSPVENKIGLDERIAENGIAMFKFVRETMGENTPVVLLSVVTTQRIVEPLMHCGITRRLEKGNLSLELVKTTVLGLIGA